MSVIPATFFERDPVECARELIGFDLVCNTTRGRIIETEAYREHGDESCHLFFRRSAREFVREHGPGAAYIYLNYGVHWLVNVLCIDQKTGDAGFVLIRSLEPSEGVDVMRERRKKERVQDLCSGPGKLTQALAIGQELHGTSLCERPNFSFQPGSLSDDWGPVVTDRRVGISKARDFPWRFLVQDHPCVSVKLGGA